MGLNLCMTSAFDYENDPWQTAELACRPQKGPGIAHRTLPCGSKVLLISPRTFKTVVARVVDRGPYGAAYKGSYRVKRNSTGKGVWRGCIDLDPMAKKGLKHNGFEKLLYIALK